MALPLMWQYDNDMAVQRWHGRVLLMWLREGFFFFFFQNWVIKQKDFFFPNPGCK
jgi:hypothetical protein